MNAYRFSDLKLGMTEEFCTAEVRGGGGQLYAIRRQTPARKGRIPLKSPGRA